MDENSFSFTVYMIHACSNRWNVAPSRVYQALKRSGCLDRYLLPSYDILHTLSTDYVVQDNRGVSGGEGRTCMNGDVLKKYYKEAL